MKLNTEEGIVVDLVALKRNFRKIIWEWLWQQNRSFYVFASNYMSNKRIILRVYTSTHYQSKNNRKIQQSA